MGRTGGRTGGRQSDARGPVPEGSSRLAWHAAGSPCGRRPQASAPTAPGTLPVLAEARAPKSWHRHQPLCGGTGVPAPGPRRAFQKVAPAPATRPQAPPGAASGRPQNKREAAASWQAVGKGQAMSR
ncbi:translation initiation factor IF-2-like isoform X1 [Canis lupus familiaris]|uniref:translation initiation factor IF-2-like isoform X1 n=1 Tax=Canis lupus familiaris TaxID=9615 RepID=UPI0018F7D767|nr:translation initiation factor IF-2-like isoform X1 [Canis lupus familiaris]